MVTTNNVSGKSLAEMSADELNMWFDQRFAETMARQDSPRSVMANISHR
jgi:heme O synthase-like polyprenyltransferase